MFVFVWHIEEELSDDFRQRFTRKKSTDVASRRKYMDEDEEDEGDDDEVFAESDEGDDAAENGNASRLRGGCQGPIECDFSKLNSCNSVSGLEGDENSSGERLSPLSLPDTTHPSSSSPAKIDKSKKPR